MAERKRLPHQTPDWVNLLDGPVFFLTICQDRRTTQDTLTDPKIAPTLLTSLVEAHARNHWYCHVALLMPDHVHALVTPGTKSLRKCVRDWKHFTSRQLGIKWQADFFEHRLRKEESIRDKADYILQNPVRAKLIQSPEDWPHLWFAN
ncbi:MAG: transposase [Verrucomicrobiota bacterium]